MLPDITSNTWAKNIFIIFYTTKTIYNIQSWEAWRGVVAGALVAAVVAAAAAGAAAGGAARGAVTILAVAVAARGPRVVREAVPIALVAGFAPSRAAAGAAA
jgi:hypothetical protein